MGVLTMGAQSFPVSERVKTRMERDRVSGGNAKTSSTLQSPYPGFISLFLNLLTLGL